MADFVTVDGNEMLVRSLETKLDRDYVFGTWLPSARAAGDKTVRPAVFNEWYPRFVERILNTARVVLLCREGAPATVHAWACAGTYSLHWAYVPPDLRRAGMARAAITAVMGSYPDTIHVTSSLPKPLRTSPRFFYNPFRGLS